MRTIEGCRYTNNDSVTAIDVYSAHLDAMNPRLYTGIDNLGDSAHCRIRRFPGDGADRACCSVFFFYPVNQIASIRVGQRGHILTNFVLFFVGVSWKFALEVKSLRLWALVIAQLLQEAIGKLIYVLK